MRFRFVAAVSGLQLNKPSGGKVELVVSGVRPVKVTLKPLPERQRKDDLQTRCIALMAREPKPAVQAGFEALAREELPEGSDEPPTMFWGVHGVLTLLPQAMRSFVNQTNRELEEAARSAIELARWRLGSGGPHQPIRQAARQYALQDRRWRDMPGAWEISVSGEAVRAITDAVKADIQALIDAGAETPLAHSLLREAKKQRRSNPRSSLVIAMAALEVGIKQHLSGRLPDLAWWLEQPTTTASWKILRDFVAPLHGLTFDERTAEQLEKATNARNLLVHEGRSSSLVGPKSLQATLAAVDQTLWWLDVLSGHTWAKIETELSTEPG